jgi:hypothetical protein
MKVKKELDEEDTWMANKTKPIDEAGPSTSTNTTIEEVSSESAKTDVSVSTDA